MTNREMLEACEEQFKLLLRMAKGKSIRLVGAPKGTPQSKWSHVAAECEAAIEAVREHLDAAPHTDEELALRYVARCERLVAIVKWCVDNSGETMTDNPRQLAYAKKILAEVFAERGRAR